MLQVPERTRNLEAVYANLTSPFPLTHFVCASSSWAHLEFCQSCRERKRSSLQARAQVGFGDWPLCADSLRCHVTQDR